MTDKEYTEIAKMCRDAVDGNIFVGSFAADCINESYPLSKAMAKIIFDQYDDVALGKKFEEWMQRDAARCSVSK